MRVLIAASAATAMSLSIAAQGFAVNGHVNDNAQHAVANLQVRLRPPANSKVPGQLSVTNGTGDFTFRGVAASQYLLEVSQGPYLLYRTVVSVPAKAPLNIVVQRK